MDIGKLSISFLNPLGYRQDVGRERRRLFVFLRFEQRAAFHFPLPFSTPTICARPQRKPEIEDGQRFGLHNLRHSLSNWLVNKAKVEPKTVQGILRHAKIQTTLDLYKQEDSDETLAAQGEYLAALGVASSMVQ